jgi:hypothetical protein
MQIKPLGLNQVRGLIHIRESIMNSVDIFGASKRFTIPHPLENAGTDR